VFPTAAIPTKRHDGFPPCFEGRAVTRNRSSSDVQLSIRFWSVRGQPAPEHSCVEVQACLSQVIWDDCSAKASHGEPVIVRTVHSRQRTTIWPPGVYSEAPPPQPLPCEVSKAEIKKSIGCSTEFFCKLCSPMDPIPTVRILPIFGLKPSILGIRLRPYSHHDQV
jgi:hypothetical protein